jgi:hypothetical protein
MPRWRSLWLAGLAALVSCNAILGNETHQLSPVASAGAENAGELNSSGTGGKDVNSAGGTSGMKATGGMKSDAGDSAAGSDAGQPNDSVCHANEPCYDGPASELVANATCARGTTSCSDSTATCVGEVRPRTELCGGVNDATDENCDGIVACTGSIKGAPALFQGGQVYAPLKSGRDAQGNEYWLGGYYQSFNLGTDAAPHNLPSGEQEEIFIAKFDPAGEVLWAQGIAGLGWQYPSDLVVHPNGELTIAGIFTTAEGEDFKIGDTALSTPNVGAGSGFIAHFDTNGNALWVDALNQTQYGAFGSLSHIALAANATGGVYAWFVAEEDVDFVHGGVSAGPKFSFGDTSGASSYVYLLSLAADGSYAAGLHGNFAQYMTTGDIVAGADGTLYAVGYHESGEINFGNIGNNSVEAPGFLLKVDAPPTTGKWLAGRTAEITDLDGLSPMRLAIDGAGNPYLGASLRVSGHKSGLLVGRWTPAGGNDWNKKIAGTVQDSASATGITVDGAGYVTVVGQCNGTVNFNPDTQTPPTTSKGACVAKYDGNGGKLLWTNFFNQTTQQVSDVNVDTLGNLHLLNLLQGQFNPGNGTKSLDSGPSTGVLGVVLYP